MLKNNPIRRHVIQIYCWGAIHANYLKMVHILVLSPPKGVITKMQLYSAQDSQARQATTMVFKSKLLLVVLEEW